MKIVGKNDPCPCGSGNKFKKCCQNKDLPFKKDLNTQNRSDSDMKMPDLDPEMMSKMQELVKKLPQHKLKEMAQLAQKAMKGEDVTAAAMQFEQTLPQGFKEMMMSQMGHLNNPTNFESKSEESMSLEDAKRIVQEAAQNGSIDANQAAELLAQPDEKKSKWSSMFNIFKK